MIDIYKAEPGELFTTDGKDVWELTSFCLEPTATLKNLRTGEVKGGAVCSLLLQDFIKLIPERTIKE